MNRRNFLKVASSAIGTGLMPASALLATNAIAQSSGMDQKKLLCIFTPNGVPTTGDIEWWHPAAGTVDLRPVSKPLEPIKNDVLFIDGLNMYGARTNTHDGGIETVLTANGPDSLDVAFGEHHQGSTLYSSLQMGPYCRRNNRGNTSFKNGSMLPFEDRAVSLYQKLWMADPSKATVNGDLGVLSVVNKDLDKLKKRLGYVERIKLEQHTDSLSALEKRILQIANNASNGAPVINFGKVTDDDWHSTHNFLDTTDVMREISIAALSTGITNSINFSFGERTFTGKMEVNGWDDHAASHAGGSDHAATKIQWMEELTKLLIRLDEVEDGSGTLFDSTLAFHYSEIGSGSGHWFFRMPFFLAGGRNWGLNSGTTLNYQPTGWGLPHHKLLTAIALKAGLPIQHFGDGHDGYREGAGYGTGPFEEIFS